jgi:hypothetical protein
LEFG